MTSVRSLPPIPLPSRSGRTNSSARCVTPRARAPPRRRASRPRRRPPRRGGGPAALLLVVQVVRPPRPVAEVAVGVGDRPYPVDVVAGRWPHDGTVGHYLFSWCRGKRSLTRTSKWIPRKHDADPDGGPLTPTYAWYGSYRPRTTRWTWSARPSSRSWRSSQRSPATEGRDLSPIVSVLTAARRGTIPGQVCTSSPRNMSPRKRGAGIHGDNRGPVRGPADHGGLRPAIGLDPRAVFITNEP